MEYRGAIKSWNDERGFGFIRPAGGGTELFFHISDYNGAGRPGEGDNVIFHIGGGRDGKPAASRVRPAFSKTARAAPPPQYFDRNSLRVWLAAIVLALAFAGAIFNRTPFALTLLYLGMGAATFGLYALDKRAARQGGWRASEMGMHVMDLAFGIAGGLLAQQVLRHKTSKRGFALTSYTIACLHIAVMGAVLGGFLDIEELLEMFVG